jgi:hypothetical protein
MGYCESSTPLLIRAKLGKLRLKTCGFPHFYFVFCFTAVSSLAVRLYGSRSSADDSPQNPFTPELSYFAKTQIQQIKKRELFVNKTICSLRLCF